MSSTPLASLVNNATSVPHSEMNPNLLSLENPVFCCYLFWATVLVVKMLLMSLLTALQRFRYKVSNVCLLAHSSKLNMLPTQLLGLLPLAVRRKVNNICEETHHI